MVTLGDIKNARENISGFVHRTPLLSTRLLSSLVGKGVYFEAECFQRTGSFKARGATNKIESLIGHGISGVFTASWGNHGQATAYVAGRLGIPAVIMVPEEAPDAKANAARSYGAEVIVGGDFSNPESVLERALSIARERNLAPIHPFEGPLVIAGQGTIGLEILEDLPDVDVVIVAVGGGASFLVSQLR